MQTQNMTIEMFVKNNKSQSEIDLKAEKKEAFNPNAFFYVRWVCRSFLTQYSLSYTRLNLT